jgi:TPR repeat protein
MLYLGHGVPRDHAAAVDWYRKAAEAGNAVAQSRYAKLLAVGEGVPLDLEEAAMWRALARRQGLTDATLDKLLVSIPPEDLQRAEERARYWPGEPPTKTAEAAPPLKAP